MELKTYLRILARYWFVIALVTLLAGAAAYALVNVRSPIYSASAQVAARPLSTITDTRTLADLIGQMGDRRITGTFAQQFASSDVQTRARETIGMSAVEAADYPLEANVLPDTHVIEISGSGPDPGRLAVYINATVDTTLTQAPAIFRVIELVRLEPARQPEKPTSPTPSRDIPLGVGLGLLLGMLLALLIDYMRGPRGVAGEVRALPQPPGQLPVRRVE